MQCTAPINLSTPEGSVMTVPCGRCMACRVNRTEEWAIRIFHESRVWDYSFFVTLTYAPEHLPQDDSISKRELQLFFKKLRKCFSFRYFACGEYGDKFNRPHYHFMLFSDNKVNFKSFIEHIWSKGFVTCEPITLSRCRYVARYTQKKLFGFLAQSYDGRMPEFALASRKPGIGAYFADLHIDNWLSKGYVILDGKKKPIPHYYLSRVSESVKKQFRIDSDKRRCEAYEKKLTLSGLTPYQQTDKDVRERFQRNLNLETKTKNQNNKNGRF